MNELTVIVGPSASGKTTYAEKVLAPKGFVPILTTTTRPPREGEVPGVDVNFTDVETFKQHLENDAVAVNTIYKGNYYGMLNEEIKAKLATGKAYAIVDVKGLEDFMKLREQFGFTIKIMSFVIPEKEAELRMLRRGDSPEVVKDRLNGYMDEMTRNREYIESLEEDFMRTATLLLVDDVEVYVYRQYENLR